MQNVSSKRRGISRLDLMIPMACVGLATALIAPAILSAREESREMVCQDHLRKIGQGALAHLDAQKHYPSNGWGSRWVGDPDRGFGPEQPGSWIYNILPYVGEEKLHDLGKGETGFKKQAAQRARIATALPLFHCPVRRPAALYPHVATALLANAPRPEKSAKTDYAVNGGDRPINTGVGPESEDAEALKSYQWPDHAPFTGISMVRSRVTAEDVTDGKSLTYLAGEKYVPKFWYGDNPLDPARPKVRNDDSTMYAGGDADVRRWTDGRPLQDADGLGHGIFGSAHADGFGMIFCDGSVKVLSYKIDDAVHKSLGNRQDGAPKSDTTF